MASAPPAYDHSFHEDDKTQLVAAAYEPSAYEPSSSYDPLSAYVPTQQSRPHATPTPVVRQPGSVQVQVMQDSSVRLRCQHCRADVMTATEFEAGNLTWLSCILLSCLGCNLGCCLIPFAVDSCKDVVHFCPNCRQQVGRYHRM